MKTNGSHGPSGFQAGELRRLLTLYKSYSIDLCKTVSKHAIRIATEELNCLNSCNACRLIALNKRPGVRPIGIGKFLRHIIGGSIVKCVNEISNYLGETYRCALDKRVASNTLSIYSGGSFLNIY